MMKASFPCSRRAVAVACLSAIFAAFASSARADDDVSQREEQAIKAAVARVAPSVVRIETFGGLERVGGMLVGTGPTTGLAVSTDGYILSSAFNFVQKPTSILVHLDDGSRLPATLVARDHSRMLVLLKVTMPAGKQLVVPTASPVEQLAVGQWSIAIGRTFDGAKPSLSVGIISAVNRIWNKAVQTDAKISSNNYGGPLVDVEGRVIGVLVPMSPMATGELAGVEWYDSGIGFAVPLADINRVLPRLEKGEDLNSGLLGVNLKGIDIYSEPATLAAVAPGSPAYLAGLKPNDQIVEINGHNVERQAELKHQLGPLYAGDRVRVVVKRGKERIEKTVELVAKLKPYETPFLGVLPSRSPAKDSEPGVTVRYVYPDSPAAKAGLKPQDRITAIGDRPIKKLDDAFEQLATLSAGQLAKFEVHRGDETLKLEAKLTTLPEKAASDPPAAHDQPPAAEGAKPPTGAVAIKIPESQNACLAYVPEDYNGRLAYGVVLWLHAPGGFKDDELVARWKPICAKYDLILVAPKSADPTKWQRTEADFIRKALDDVLNKYHVDRSRVVVCGEEGGAAMAWAFASANHEQVRAIAAFGAALPAMASWPPADPVLRLAAYVGIVDKEPLKKQMQATIDRLRGEKYPVTVASLGPGAHPLTADQLADLARWIDSLDRF
jgi:serine protease Do